MHRTIEGRRRGRWPARSSPRPRSPRTGTLKKIKDTGAITIGHRDASIPFSYYDDKQQPIGYAMDLCAAHRRRGEEGAEDAEPRVKYQLVTSANRIPLMANGTIDLECGSTTNNLDAPEAGRRSPITHFVTANRWVAKKSSNIKSLDDLKGKTIVSTAGTTNIKQITEINADEEPGHEHHPGQRPPRGVPDGRDRPRRRVRDGRHPALQPRRQVAQPRRTTRSRRRAVGRARTASCAQGRRGVQEGRGRRDDRSIYKSGEINEIYDKWFLKPIPPKGINLNVPMSDALKKVVAEPDRLGRPDGVQVSCTDAGGLQVPRSFQSRSARELQLELEHPAAARAGRHGHLPALPAGRPRLDARHRARRLGHRARVGSVVGTLRTTPLKWVVRLGNAYVEIFRNVPLLVQMFLWFFVLPELLPEALGDGSSRCRRPWSVVSCPAVLCLGLFTSVRVAEQVRAGIQSLPRGQRMAGTAMGLTLGADLPLRAAAAGLPHHPAAAHLGVHEHHQELVGRAHHRPARAHRARAAMQEFSFKVFEAFAAATVIYLVTNLIVVLLMRCAREQACACPGFIAAGGAPQAGH